MVLKAFSVYDDKAKTFNTPFYKHTHGEAERDFKTAVNEVREGNNLNKYPEDYDLFFIGEYDDQTGKFEALSTPQHVCKAVMVKH